MLPFASRSLMPAGFVAGAVISATLVARAQVAPPVPAPPPPANAPAADAPATRAASAAPDAAAALAGVAYPQVAMAGVSREYRAIPIKDSKADGAIRAALREPMRRLMDFEESPLRAVIEEFRDATGLPIVCDTAALTDAGIDLDATTVTQSLARMPGLSVAAALRLVLRDAGLTWVVGSEVLTVTTHERAYEHLPVVAYPLPRAFGDNRPADFQVMIDLIQATVSPATWDAVGGAGSIRLLETAGQPLLVVAQTGEVHGEIEALLRRIHERLLEEFAHGKPVLRVHRVADRGVLAELGDSLKDACNASLGERGDAAAEVSIVGASLIVSSTSPEFHVLAAQTAAAVAGILERPALP